MAPLSRKVVTICISTLQLATYVTALSAGRFGTACRSDDYLGANCRREDCGSGTYPGIHCECTACPGGGATDVGRFSQRLSNCLVKVLKVCPEVPEVATKIYEATNATDLVEEAQPINGSQRNGTARKLVETTKARSPTDGMARSGNLTEVYLSEPAAENETRNDTTGESIEDATSRAHDASSTAGPWIGLMLCLLIVAMGLILWWHLDCKEGKEIDPEDQPLNQSGEDHDHQGGGATVSSAPVIPPSELSVHTITFSC